MCFEATELFVKLRHVFICDCFKKIMYIVLCREGIKSTSFDKPFEYSCLSECAMPYKYDVIIVCDTFDNLWSR